MGLKRIMAVIEVTYPADDSRSLDTLTQVTATAVSDGAVNHGGVLARIGITGAAVDPDPEPSADDGVPATEPVEAGDPVIP